MTKQFDDFTYKLTRLMPNNKMAPQNALWLSVKTEHGFQSGMLVKIGCKEKEYLNAAKLVRVHIQKQITHKNVSPVEIPTFIKQIEVEQKRYMKPWNRFIRFIKKLFTKKSKR